MHGAPSVNYPVGRSSFALAAMGLVWAAALAGIALWSVQSQPSESRIVLALAVALLAGAIALRSWLLSTGGSLAWNGEGWTWTCGTEGEPGTPEVTLDTQRVLLVRWSAGRRTRWLWLERASLPARWDDLRRAVYSRAP